MTSVVVQTQCLHITNLWPIKVNPRTSSVQANVPVYYPTGHGISLLKVSTLASDELNNSRFPPSLNTTSEPRWLDLRCPNPTKNPFVPIWKAS